MKANRHILNGLLVLGGFIALFSLARAQLSGPSLHVVTSSQPPATDSIIQLTADAQGLALVPAGALPQNGTFWLMMPSGFSAPYPCPPPGSLPTYSIVGNEFLVDSTDGKVALSPVRIGGKVTTPTVAEALEAMAQSVVDLVAWIQGATAKTRKLTMSKDDSDPSPPGGGGGGGGGGFTNSYGYCFDTNQLWLNITNVSGGMAFVNLRNGTNYVYEIFTKTNLLQATWTIAGEVFPTDTNCNPFTVAAQAGGDPPCFFVWARDWTGVTSQGNTVPEWWFYYWYGAWGVMNLSDATLDSGGNNTLLYDYTNHQAPANVIQFTVAVTNNYMATANASAQIVLQGGLPGYIAIAVDNTNDLNTTNWTAYTTSNITLPLGSTQGWHDVWIGLRGHADDPTNAVWQWTRLKLDTTPPQLAVTNPAASMVDRPVIQLQGFANEALQAIAYDITNACGLATNQQMMVIGQTYSTNTAEFTTNYFQAYDVPLTNGLNVITLHATDLAGNVTTTNFTFTLDYSNKPAPAMQLLWPLAGMEICGSNIVCRGQLSDDTATVTVQLVDANGVTNIVGSLVGRDGVFYADALTLATGTNYLSYTVTDAAGNATNVRIAVATSSLGLTMNAVSAGQAQVMGTIDDSSYTVYVNGMQAGVTNGNWTAQITPIGVSGGAVVVNAVKSGGDPSLQQIVQPPQGAFISAYHSQDQTTFIDPEALFYGKTDYDTLDWEDGRDGTSESFYYEEWYVYNPIQHDRVWAATDWPQALPDGTDTVTDWNLDPTNSYPPTATHTNVIDPPVLAQEHCDVAAYTQSAYYYRRTADTEMSLATGGPPGSRQMNLWCISATARAYTNLYDTTGIPVPPEQIQIGKFGNQDTNGNLWVMLPDNDPDNITPMIAGIFNFIFPDIRSIEYTPAIVANNVRLDPNSVTNNANFCVGQSLNFAITGLPDRVYDVSAVWTLPGTFVNTNSDPNCDLFYEVNTNFLIPPQGTTSTHCWYVKDGQPLTASVHLYYRCTKNGKLFDEIVTGKFNVHRPTTAKAQPYQPDGTPTVQILGGCLSLGITGVANDMSFRHQITTDSSCAGQAGYVQLIHGGYTQSSTGNWVDIEGANGIPDTELDNRYGEFPRGQAAIPANTNTNVWFCDAPADGLHQGNAKMDVEFSTYLMFRPSGGIWVPLRLITWELHDEAANNAVVNGTVIPPSDADSTNFPRWENKFSHF